MKEKIKSRLRRAAASVLAAATLFSQPIWGNTVHAAEAKSTGYPVKVAEQNPFDGLYTPQTQHKDFRLQRQYHGGGNLRRKVSGLLPEPKPFRVG